MPPSPFFHFRLVTPGMLYSRDTNAIGFLRRTLEVVFSTWCWFQARNVPYKSITVRIVYIAKSNKSTTTGWKPRLRTGSIDRPYVWRPIGWLAAFTIIVSLVPEVGLPGAFCIRRWRVYFRMQPDAARRWDFRTRFQELLRHIKQGDRIGNGHSLGGVWNACEFSDSVSDGVHWPLFCDC